MKIQAILAGAAALLISSVASAQVTMSVTTDVDPSTLDIGDTITLDILLRNPTMSSIQGIGLSVHDYDEAVADFVSGTATEAILYENIIEGVGCFTGLDNTREGALAESEIGVNGNRVLIIEGAGLTAFAQTGEGDCGIDGMSNSTQFEVTFQAIGDGTTTLIIGTGYEGDAVILTGGVQADAVNATVAITVPEPGTMAAGAVALSSVLGLAGIRRRL
ncbi:MAG: hypothetical protein AB8G23_13465 [Myxococcota bacterium]